MAVTVSDTASGYGSGVDLRFSAEDEAFREQVRDWLGEHLVGEFASLGDACRGPRPLAGPVLPETASFYRVDKSQGRRRRYPKTVEGSKHQQGDWGMFTAASAIVVTTVPRRDRCKVRSW